LNSEEIYSHINADNEASRGLSTKEKLSDVSFVLERKTADSSGSSPGKMGMFTIALVMCVCCLSQFFTPVGTDLAASVAGAKAVKGMPGITG
jgi:hypothetical protein